MTDEQHKIMCQLTWPAQYGGATATHTETTLYINGVRVILYPNGKLDIISVDEQSDSTEAVIREKYGDRLLGHVRTYRRHSAEMLDGRCQIRRALEGDSNDAEHDALAAVAEHFDIDWRCPDV